MRKESWRKGYALEISKSIIEYAFSKVSIQKLVGESIAKNEASIKLLKKLGMKQEMKDGELEIYSLSKDG